MPVGSTSPARQNVARVDAELFRLLVGSVKDYAIFMLSPEGHVLTWNAGAEAIKGYTASEVIGQHFSVFYESEAIARAWPDHELTLAKANGRFEDEGWRLRKDGTRFWASVVITPLYSEDRELRGFAKVTRDLTSRLRYEEIQRSERQTNEFLAMLAHELRNPLAPMQTALDLVARAKDDSSIVEMALTIFSRQVSHLTRMVDDLLDVGRITTGKIELKFEQLDLNELVLERTQVFQPMYETRGQSLTVAVPSESTLVLADATRLAQVVSNLLANAHKFTKDGGHVSVTVRREGVHGLLEVQDDGRGIEPHLLSLIFHPFVQAQGSGMQRSSGGLGLGLTLVKRLVELHGGTVAAASGGLGMGSTFSVKLPLHQAPVSRPRVVVPVGATPALRVLVVDDNEDIAKSMAMLVRSLGHEADVSFDGVSAIVKAGSFQAQVLLLDIGLPHMDGYEVARALRTLPVMRGATLVACTGYGRESDRDKALKAGFDHHLVKPVSADKLLEIFASAAEKLSSIQNKPG